MSETKEYAVISPTKTYLNPATGEGDEFYNKGAETIYVLRRTKDSHVAVLTFDGEPAAEWGMSTLHNLRHGKSGRTLGEYVVAGVVFNDTVEGDVPEKKITHYQLAPAAVEEAPAE